MEKIAVVNRTNLKNYGSVLQCYALCKAIHDMGYDAEILWEQGNVSRNFDFRPVKMLKTAFKIASHPNLLKSTLKSIKEIKSKPISEETIKLFDDFVEKHIKQKLLSHQELVDIAKTNEYKKFVCGSDQIWCSTTTYVDPLMYLRFVPQNKRIAYAPSIGRDYIPNYNRRQMRKYIKEIPYVSIRETEGKRLVKELTGRDVPVVLDPTLLIEREHWDTLIVSEENQSSFLLCYFLDEPDEKTQRNIMDFAKENQLSIISLGQELSFISEEIEIKRPKCGPNEFLGYVSKANLVVTDSYHGMLFSIIYEKNFWSVERAYKQFDQSSRQMTVLQMVHLESRYVRSDYKFNCEKINYDFVKKTIAMKKSESKKYLLTAIEC